MKAGLKPSILEDALTHLREKLKPVTETPGLDAQVLIAHVCQKDKSWILAHPEYELSSNETAQLNRNLKTLLDGTPLPYVLGEWEFFGRMFKVTPDVLIPRPETELLVETALAWLRDHPEKRIAAEVGTGSGCIPVSLAAEVPDLKITATEILVGSADVARGNVEKHGVGERVSIHIDDLLTSQTGPFNLIAANLPYIPTNTLKSLDVYQREPTLALDGGPDGLDLIEKVLHQAAERISPGGLVLLEIETGQGDSALALAEQVFPQALSEIKADLAGHPRLLVVQT
jgi:release factor glutamine methyltransferase